jgi:hypothetical protein
VIVMADYGAGFWPGESRRTPSRTDHPEDVLLVPLFVKAPGQTGPRIVDDVTQTIDVVPTIADVLGLEVPWPLDGCSVLDASCERPRERRVLRLDGTPQGRATDTYPADLHARRATLERKWAQFPTLAHVEAAWPVGEFEAWRGRPVEALPVEPGESGAEPGRFVVDRSARDWTLYDGGPRVAGTVEFPPMSAVAGDAIPIAFAVNGVVEAMAITWPDARGRLRVEAMLGERRLAASGNTLAVFYVEGEGDAAKLRPLALKSSGRKKKANRPPK